MSISPEAVRLDEDMMEDELGDGRTLGGTLARFPRLMRAAPAERDACTPSSRGLQREALDEDVSVAGLLAGQGDRTRSGGPRAERSGS